MCARLDYRRNTRTHGFSTGSFFICIFVKMGKGQEGDIEIR